MSTSLPSAQHCGTTKARHGILPFSHLLFTRHIARLPHLATYSAVAISSFTLSVLKCALLLSPSDPTRMLFPVAVCTIGSRKKRCAYGTRNLSIPFFFCHMSASYGNTGGRGGYSAVIMSSPVQWVRPKSEPGERACATSETGDEDSPSCYG